MEKTVTFYQECIKTLLREYDGLHTEGSQIELILDDDRLKVRIP